MFLESDKKMSDQVPSTDRRESTFSYVVRHSTRPPSISMTTALDRPEGYGIIAPAYRLTMAHRRAPPTPQLAEPKKKKFDVGALLMNPHLLHDMSSSDSMLTAQLSGRVSKSPRTPFRAEASFTSGGSASAQGLSALFEGVVAAAELDYTRSMEKVANLPLPLASHSITLKSENEKATKDTSLSIAPRKQQRAATAPLTETNVHLYRLEPHDPSTGQSLLDLLRLRRVERWVQQQQQDEEMEQSHHQTQSVSVVEHSSAMELSSFTFLTEGGPTKSNSPPQSPVKVEASAISTRWKKLRTTVEAVGEVHQQKHLTRLSLAVESAALPTPKDLRNPFSDVETAVSTEISWMSRRLSSDGTAMRLAPIPIRSASLLKEVTVEPTLTQQRFLHSILEESDLPETEDVLQCSGTSRSMSFGDLRRLERSSSFSSSATFRSNRTQSVYCRQGNNAAKAIDLTLHGSSMNLVSGRHSYQRHWNTEFQTCLDEMFNATSGKAVVLSYTKLRGVQSEFVRYCIGYVAMELQKTLLKKVQTVDNNVIFSLVSTPLKDLPEAAVLHSTKKRHPETGNEEVEESDEESDDGNSAEAREDDLHVSENIDPTVQQRKVASNDLASLTFLYKQWWKVADPSYLPFVANPFVHQKAFSSLATDRQTHLPKKPNRRDTCAFPLTCHVQFLGHTVVCTATMLTEAEPPQPVTPNLQGSEACQEMMFSLGNHLRIAPYILEADQDSGRQEKCVVFTSRNVLVGKGDKGSRVYISSLATLMPPIVPSTGLAPTLRLRPEFTSSMTDPVVSDAFDPQIAQKEMPSKCAAQVLAVKTMRRLVHKSFSNLLNSLEASAGSLKGSDLCKAFHQCGINLSFLGRLGDLVVERLRCVRSGAGPSTASVERLTRLLAVVREELAARAFRVCWSAEMRSLLETKNSISSDEQNRRTTVLIHSLLGSESDAETTSFWQNVLTPMIRRKFGYRSPISRGDVGVRSVLRRLETLCGIIVGELPPTATPTSGKDGDSVKGAKSNSGGPSSNSILGAEIREARTATLGYVERILPYVKTPGVPSMPPLWHHSDLFASQIEKSLESLIGDVVEDEGGDSESILDLRLRLAEVYLTTGEHKYRDCEQLLNTELRRCQSYAAPSYRDVVELCVCLAGFYHIEHRFVEASKFVHDAIQVELDYQTSPQHPLLEMMFAVAVKSTLDAGQKAAAVGVIERCTALLMKRMNSIELSPLSILDEPETSPRSLALASRTLDTFRVLLQNSMGELVSVYTSVGPELFPQPAEIVKNVAFLKFLCDLGLDEVKNFRTIPAIATFARCVQLAESLKEMAIAGRPIGADPKKRGKLSEAEIAEKLLAKCEQNLATAKRIAATVSGAGQR